MSEPVPSALPLGARAIAAARSSVVAVLGEDSGVLLPARVAELLSGGGSVGAVVPGGAGSDRRRDIRTTKARVVAVAPGALEGFDVDPGLDDPTSVVEAVVDHVRRRGLRVLEDASWSPGSSRAQVPSVSRREEPQQELLVVTAYLDDSPAALDDQLAFELVRSIRDSAEQTRITVLLTDGFRSERQVARLRSNGVEVVAPPLDRDRWLAERAGTFSHVVLTTSGLQSISWAWLARTQPQAARVLYVTTLPFRDVAALAPLTPPAERASLESVRSGVESQMLEIADQADAIWCDTDADARWVRGCTPGTPVHVVPSALPHRATLSLEERSGIFLLGDLGHDVVAANEDAAGSALSNLVPLLRTSLPDLPVVVAADNPSPYLTAEISATNAVLVAGSAALEAVGRARIAVDLHSFGTGGETALRMAMEAGTPFVAHPAAAGRLDLGPLAPSLLGAPEDLAYRARALLTSSAAWHEAHRQVDEWAGSIFDPGRRVAALKVALFSLGIEAGVGGLWIDDAPAKDLRPAATRVNLSLRPSDHRWRPATQTELPSPWDHDRRYQLWADRYGLDDRGRTSVAAEVERLPYQPLVSVLVPVYNTPSGILRETIDSVRTQIYPHWELCLADDRSTDAQTVAVLAEAERMEQVKVVRLAGNSGISAATNAAADVATGEFVALLDHDDLLKPHALAQVVRWLNADRDLDYIYTDEDKVDEDGRLVQPHLKPDWSPNMIMSQNYVCHLSVIRRSIWDEVGGLRSSFDGSQDHDLVLRVSELTDRITHIPEPLYTWRIMAGSTSGGVDAKPYAADAARRALREAIARRGRPGTVTDASIPGMYRTSYRLHGSPRVAIVIPTKGSVEMLRTCVRSIYERSTYGNFEVVIIDNQTTDGPTLEYLAGFPGRVIRYDHIFNYARMMNVAARTIDCDAFLFLNNDTEVITPEWIEELLQHAMRPEVGAVGGRLYFGDRRVQHEGIVVGVGGWANNIDHQGYWGRGDIIRDTSAITGACTMIRSSVYWRVGGNEERLRIAYNDVDICLRIRQAGYQVVYTPYAELYHHEGSSRSGMEHQEDGPQFGIRWRPTEGVDPFFHPAFQKVMPPFVIDL